MLWKVFHLAVKKWTPFSSIFQQHKWQQMMTLLRVLTPQRFEAIQLLTQDSLRLDSEQRSWYQQLCVRLELTFMKQSNHTFFIKYNLNSWISITTTACFRRLSSPKNSEPPEFVELTYTKHHQRKKCQLRRRSAPSCKCHATKRIVAIRTLTEETFAQRGRHPILDST